MESPVELAIRELRCGKPILVVDDEDRENEGDLIVAAELITPDVVALMIRHTSGIICVAVTDERANELELAPMVSTPDDPRETAFTVSVDARSGVTTGVSAADRSTTIRALADPATRPEALTRPGHVFPLRARPGGVLQRAGHTESAVDMCRLAGLEPVGVLAEVCNDDGTMARRADLVTFAERHRLVMISVADLVRYRRECTSLLERGASGRVPTDVGEFKAISFRSSIDGCEHVAFVLGETHQDSGEDDPILVRVHSECLTGDIFGSRRCDCGQQLDKAMQRIAEAGRGVIVYLRGHEGRGIGLSHKLRAYTLQDTGLDTVEANLAQKLPVDSRNYGVGAQILRGLGIRAITLMTNNPAKYRGLAGHGIRICGREPIEVNPNADNVHYMTAKQIRLEHHLHVSDGV